VLVAGSLFLVGAARQVLLGEVPDPVPLTDPVGSPADPVSPLTDPASPPADRA
jgi:hypothetical protein